MGYDVDRTKTDAAIIRGVLGIFLLAIVGHNTLLQVASMEGDVPKATLDQGADVCFHIFEGERHDERCGLLHDRNVFRIKEPEGVAY